jgi:hypothetical protein
LDKKLFGVFVSFASIISLQRVRDRLHRFVVVLKLHRHPFFISGMSMMPL